MSILSKINEFKKKAKRFRDATSSINQGIDGIRSLVTGEISADARIRTGISGVEQIKANLDKGVARPSRYAVYITPPRMLVGQNTSYLLFRTEATELPGQNINVFNHQPMGFGNQRQMAAGYNMYPNLGVTFMASADYREWRFFSGWHDGIVKKPGKQAENRGGTHLVNYYDQFTCQIAVVGYNELGDVVYECFFNDAYPIQLSPINLNWAATDSVVTFPVQFAYRDWYDNAVRDSSQSKFPNILTGIDARIGSQITGALETGFKAFGVSDPLPSGVRDAVNVITGGGLLNFN
jgi:hypothetical protein